MNEIRLIDANRLKRQIANWQLSPTGGKSNQQKAKTVYDTLDEVLDVIEDAQAIPFPPAPQWISVNDRLPTLHEECFDDNGDVCQYEISDWVLVTTGEPGDVYVSPMEVAHFVRSGAIAQWENGGGACNGVTHWMPVPEPLDQTLRGKRGLP